MYNYTLRIPLPLSPLANSPFYPLLLTWNPPSCDRNRPPRSQVACKLTLPCPTPHPNPPPSKFPEPQLPSASLRLFPTRLLTSEDEYKWFWHQMIYFPGTINIVSTRLYCHIIYINKGSTFHLPAMHVNLLCACWHSEAVKGSSSFSTRRLLISLRITSFLFLCPEPTDAPWPYYEDPAPPSPRWRPHPQGPHTLPFQGPRQRRPQEYSDFFCPEQSLLDLWQ